MQNVLINPLSDTFVFPEAVTVSKEKCADPEDVLLGYGWCNDDFFSSKMGQKYISKLRRRLSDQVRRQIEILPGLDILLNQTAGIFAGLNAQPLDVQYIATCIFLHINTGRYGSAGIENMAMAEMEKQFMMFPNALHKYHKGSAITKISEILDEQYGAAAEQDSEKIKKDQEEFSTPAGRIVDYAMFEYELNSSCMEYLKRRCAADSGLIRENCMIMAVPSIPDECADLCSILLDAYNYCCVDLERDLAYSNIDDLTRKECAEIYTAISKERDAALQAQKNAEKETEDYKHKYNILMQKYNAEKGRNRCEELQNIINDQQKCINRYLLQIENLEEELARDRYEEEEIPDDEEKEDDELYSEFDLNGRYLFFSTDPEFEIRNKRILQVFPNSKFIRDPDQMNAATTDAVLMLTRHVRHDAYYACKNACKSKGVPLIHISYRNPDMIVKKLTDMANGTTGYKEALSV